MAAGSTWNTTPGRDRLVTMTAPNASSHAAPSRFDQATNEAARYAAQLTKKDRLVSIAGGGDTVSALNQAGAADDFSYISTAGGAFLEWLEGKPLPGIQALTGVET